MDSNDKILLSGSNVSLDLSQDVINLCGIPNDFAVRCLRNLLIVAPTTKFQTVAFTAVFCGVVMAIVRIYCQKGIKI